MWAIQRIEDGKFVSISNSKSSYTNSLRKARLFSSKEQAEADGVCGNEVAVNIDQLFHVVR